MFDDYVGSAEVRREAWRRKFENDHVLRKAEPNRGHRAVALDHPAERLAAAEVEALDEVAVEVARVRA